MMDIVTLANIGDLVQPFQNSRYFTSAIQGFGFYRSPLFSKELHKSYTKRTTCLETIVFIGVLRKVITEWE